MSLQLISADYLHDDGVTYRIRRNNLEQDFTIEEKRDGAWVDCGLDQAVKDVNFAKFKRLGLLIKKVIDSDQWLAWAAWNRSCRSGAPECNGFVTHFL